MKIAALQKTSFVDYPGKIAAVVFTQGCNLNCVYCHNRMLIGKDEGCNGISVTEVFEYLRKRQGLLDAVVISGGEPTLQSDLAEFIENVHRLDYRVKLDTNGTHPTVLASLMGAGLLDYVAMDIKVPPEKYESICRVPVYLDAIEASIDLLLSAKLDYEFRTTVVPQLTQSDILIIGRRLQGARRYVLQQYRRPQWAASLCDEELAQPPHTLTWALRTTEEIKSLVMECHARGFDTHPSATSPSLKRAGIRCRH